MMIVKHIPFSAYQVKTVNYRQLIQAPLKYFDNYFDGCRHSRWLLVQNLMAKSGVLESWSHRSWNHGVMELWCHVQCVIGWNLPSSMNKGEQLMKKSTIHLCTLSYFKVKCIQ